MPLDVHMGFDPSPTDPDTLLLRLMDVEADQTKPITSVNSNDSTAGNFNPWDLDGDQP